MNIQAFDILFSLSVHNKLKNKYNELLWRDIPFTDLSTGVVVLEWTLSIRRYYTLWERETHTADDRKQCGLLINAPLKNPMQQIASSLTLLCCFSATWLTGAMLSGCGQKLISAKLLVCNKTDGKTSRCSDSTAPLVLSMSLQLNTASPRRWKWDTHIQFSDCLDSYCTWGIYMHTNQKPNAWICAAWRYRSSWYANSVTCSQKACY